MMLRLVMPDSGIEAVLTYGLVFVLCGGGFLFFAGMHYHILYLRFIKHAEYIPSPAPFLGGILGAILVFVLTRFHWSWLILLPLVLDPGSIPFLIQCIVLLFKEFVLKK